MSHDEHVSIPIDENLKEAMRRNPDNFIFGGREISVAMGMQGQVQTSEDGRFRLSLKQDRETGIWEAVGITRLPD